MPAIIAKVIEIICPKSAATYWSAERTKASRSAPSSLNCRCHLGDNASNLRFGANGGNRRFHAAAVQLL